jgi:hydroxymethylbilane synthase
MKDVETIRPEAFTIAAYLPREDSADRLIGADSVDALTRGAVVGTSRRGASAAARPPARSKVVPIRGNVQNPRLS